MKRDQSLKEWGESTGTQIMVVFILAIAGANLLGIGAGSGLVAVGSVLLFLALVLYVAIARHQAVEEIKKHMNS